jgi:uncharacterized repeat protein (TIGR04076 family)
MSASSLNDLCVDGGSIFGRRNAKKGLAFLCGHASAGQRSVADGPWSTAVRSTADVTEMRLYDLRVTVERIEGRSVCGLEVGDFFEVTESSRVRIPEGRHFCLFAMQSVLALLPAKMRHLPDEDWLEQDSLVACPDPEERLVMRIERIGQRTLVTEELT